MEALLAAHIGVVTKAFSKYFCQDKNLSLISGNFFSGFDQVLKIRTSRT